MRIVEINTCLDGSTGKIMRQIAQTATNKGYKVWTVSSYQRKKLRKISKTNMDLTIGNFFSLYFHLYVGKITGYKGLFSVLSTIRMLYKLRTINPDIIHLHNLHDSYINLPILFNYIKREKLPVIWTLHDCWTFTGKCPYFTLANCEKWKTGCGRCSQLARYPEYNHDTTAAMYRMKKSWFTGIKNMMIVTPSNWLAGLVKQSYLQEYNVLTINNGIDLSLFKPTNTNIREKYNLQNKYLVLGVAFEWGVRKGLDIFISLASQLGEDYQIILVGTDDKTDQQLPDNIISIQRTNNQEELAGIYTAADVFVNPTREEVLGMVNIEALACGTPVITFKTGGSPECIDDTCGSVIECEDVKEIQKQIEKICKCNIFSEHACIKRAKEFDMNKLFNEYVELYEKISCAAEEDYE